MDANNLVVLIVMIVLMVGGALILNLQISRDAKKEMKQKQAAQAEAAKISQTASQES